MIVSVDTGTLPIILAFPHSGTEMPPEIRARLNETGLRLSDTDWHLDRLYDGLLPGASVVRAGFHRYVIDANRDPTGASLYPGQNTTGLVPLTDFDGDAIWDSPPDAAEIEARRAAFHAPYHAALAVEIARVRAQHGIAVLYDCHSIRSRIPFLFEGVLPDINIGTFNGTTCAPEMEAATAAEAAGFGRPWVLNGRFRGGWTTRHYGRPNEGCHAVQMELAQSTHLATEQPPYAYDPDRAAHLRPVLTRILTQLNDIAQRLAAAPRKDQP